MGSKKIENCIDLRSDLVDNILYWVAQMIIEETVIPESTDETCLCKIKEYIEKQRK